VYTSLISVLIALNIILLGLAYSLPVIRLKDRPLGGLAANALAYGFFIPILAARPVYSLDDLYSAVPYVLAIAAGYVFTAIPDLPGDKESGKKTIAVILGAGPARVIGTAFISVTAFAGFFVGNWELGVTALIGTAIGLVSCVKTNRSADLAAAKIPIFILLLFTAAHFPFFLLVILLTIILTRAYYKLKFDVTYPKLL
jgi:1,4-dihydroxy-2-naphthoate octaprenyltransferase